MSDSNEFPSSPDAGPGRRAKARFKSPAYPRDWPGEGTQIRESHRLPGKSLSGDDIDEQIRSFFAKDE